ncbi:MAG: helix-turn-helix transcriptional regulator [Holophagales bacterium]|nr:helix-turn-helix transcriptional regulator [Holophagales bacterium]
MAPRAARDAVLPFGAFFGHSRARRRAGDFVLERLSATVPEPEVARHTHEEAHFVLVTRGTYITAARGAPAPAGPPLLVYNPPGTTHRDRFLSEGGRFLTISVPAHALARAAEVVRLPAGSTLLTGEAVLRAGRLVGLSSGGGTAGTLAAESLCLELLDWASGVGPASRPLPDWLRRARDLLHDADGELSMRDVAAALGVHPVHLARAFRARLGTTPGDYLRRTRLERAASLLARGQESLSSIALSTGFCDQSHLSRSFRREYGLAPGEYRRSVSSPRPKR